MNLGLVRWGLSRVLLIEAALMVVPLIVSLIYREGLQNAMAFVIPIIVLTILGIAISKKKPEQRQFFTKEGFVLTAFTWIVLSLFGAVPFLISGEIPGFVNAWFESVSGLTTTGSSVVTDVEALSHSMLFWRSFTQFIGGMGILVFTMALLPALGDDSVYIMKAEVPGPTFGKLLSKTKNTAQLLYFVYLILFLLTVILLILGDMPIFDSILHAFGTSATGGFNIRNSSVLHYQSAYTETVLAVAMLLCGINFNLYFYVITRNIRYLFRSEELRWYIGFLVASTVAITINTLHMYPSAFESLRHSFFTVSSIISTTAFSTVDFDLWPLTSKIILILMMFMGGMAGSTSGGIKLSRIVIAFKTAVAEVKRVLQPHRKVVVRFEGKAVPKTTLDSIIKYLIVYTFVFWGFILLVSYDAPNFTVAFAAVSATLNNIGPGFDAIGPSSNFLAFSPFTKIVLIFSMIAGRLEIYPILFIFMPQTWKKY